MSFKVFGLGWLVLAALIFCPATANAQFTGQSLDNSERLDHDAFRDDLRQDLHDEEETAAGVDRPFAPAWSFVGTLSPLYTNNALLSTTDPISDFYFLPDLNVRLDGRAGPKTSYRLYARSEVSAFARVEDANFSLALVGARLTQDVAQWRATLIYENRHSYNGIYDDAAVSSNDLNATLTRDYSFGRLTLMPFFYAGQRFADIPAATRFRFDAVLGLEYRLAPRLALVSTPFFEVNVFEDGANKGRRDQVYSVDIGLQYDISDRLFLTTSVVSEHRVSNFEGQSYEMLEIGPHLDFVF
jgi:hypothetical protein